MYIAQTITMIIQHHLHILSQADTTVRNSANIQKTRNIHMYSLWLSMNDWYGAHDASNIFTANSKDQKYTHVLTLSMNDWYGAHDASNIFTANFSNTIARPRHRMDG